MPYYFRDKQTLTVISFELEHDAASVRRQKEYEEVADAKGNPLPEQAAAPAPVKAKPAAKKAAVKRSAARGRR